MEKGERRLAIIGTRDLDGWRSRSPHTVSVLAAVAASSPVDWITTGACAGVDQFAAECRLRAGGKVELYVPWPGYEFVWVKRMLDTYGLDRVRVNPYTPSLHGDWTASVAQYHPNPASLTPAARNLHARNYGIVLRAEAVVALPSLSAIGGTGQGMRVARGLHRPVMDMSKPEVVERLATAMADHGYTEHDGALVFVGKKVVD